ncbi:methyltransferase domain-containing protein, partial [Planktomarina temperata]|nr:methyltransferase domain-containing protein [Planktomarina temperata]
VVFKQPNTGLQKTITSLLDRKSFVRPSDIARAAISLLKFEPKLKRHLQTSSVAEPEPKLLEAVTDLSELPLLLKLMSVCPLPDLALENLIRELRASLLLSISDLTGSTAELKFQSALALQCFTNEYIYNQSEHEDKALTALAAASKQTLNNGDQPSPQSILCLASYKPLNQYKWASSLRITNEIEDVFTRQVVEPNQESQIKTTLPVLEAITDKVSSKVRDQYEVSPYPRWVNTGLRLKPAPISKLVEEIKLKLLDDKITKAEAPNILIAGCGTGQHSIGTAARFKGSKILAIDLSLSSLSYAKRKTEELGFQNIDYMQADILNLGNLGRQFDIVESAGVLHHMDDPVAGWRVLTDCLKPGGLMRIGLYSELARQNHITIRAEIYKSGIRHTQKEMKLFRKNIIRSLEQHHTEIKLRNDFYSLSNFRDLLFHVQEHRFTIPQIRDCLSELGLKFCGFESDKIVSHFKQTNTGADDPYELDKWQAYEEANPSAFAGMYQFWCQKVA